MTGTQQGILQARLAQIPLLSEKEQQTVTMAIERIVSIADPQRIILFGSRARGQSREHSDIDLLVILPDTPLFSALWDSMLHAVHGLVPAVDIVPTTATGFAERSQLPFFVERYAAQEGFVVYEH